MRSTDQVRWLSLAEAVNVRDIGGWPASDGQTVRYSHVFRGDSLDACSVRDLAALTDAGVHHRIDLRALDEVPEDLSIIPIGALASSRTPMLTRGADSNANPILATEDFDMVEFYLRFLTVGAAYTITALQAAIEHCDEGVVLHCAGGKDRTGVLVALLLRLLGVSDGDIVRDYALTGERKAEIKARMVASGYGERLASLPASLLDAAPTTMTRFLARLDSDFGSAEGWALSAGLPPASLTALRATMLR
jgi:protein-tyrosine phosphatase